MKAKIFTFNEAYKAPINNFNTRRGIVEWGDDNNYPEYLLDLYNFYGSSAHKTIVDRKSMMVAGQGFVEEMLSPEMLQFVKRTGLEVETLKAAIDFEIFNGYAFEVIYDRLGENIAMIKHVPLHKLRIGIPSEEFPEDHYWFSNKWSEHRKPMYKPQYIRAYDPLNPGGRQLFYYSLYNPKYDGGYPIPGYSNSMNWIELDYQIGQFHLNQVKQGYNPSILVNFGEIPTPEEQDLFEKEFNRNFSGSENAGKAMITYSETNDGKPEIVAFQSNDTDKRFNLLKDQTKEEIVLGAGIPPALLLVQPGKLGGTEDRQELMDEFQKAYISPRQNQIENSLNQILMTNEIELKKYTA